MCVFYYENFLTNERKCSISFSTLVIAQPYKMVNSYSNVVDYLNDIFYSTHFLHAHYYSHGNVQCTL
jgi:hypothetical protein